MYIYNLYLKNIYIVWANILPNKSSIAQYSLTSEPQIPFHS